MHSMLSFDSDTLVFDIPAARQLAHAMSAAANELFSDQVALGRILEEATSLLERDHTGTLVPLASARRGLEELSGDLRWRLDVVDRTAVDLAAIDALSSQLIRWSGQTERARPGELSARRREAILALVDGNVEHAGRIEAAIGSGLTAREAVQAAQAEIQHEARIAALMDAFGLGEVAAAQMITRVDRNLSDLADRGIGQDDAVAAMAIVENFGLDLDAALEHAAVAEIGLLDSLGRMLTAQGLGVSLDEFVALEGLEQHFDVFDNATGGTADQRVSVADLTYVVDHRWFFTPSQVLAAQAMLDQPVLRNRLDTANRNTDVFSSGGFGSRVPGDGLIADADLKAFMLKAQIHHVLGDYADEIDVANDPSGVVDGYHSENDLRKFIAGNPHLPESVLAAAGIALDSGWFDESWWQEHKDELAMGAALLAAGLAVVVTGGGASMLLVIGAGALAAAGTTVAVNLATGAPMLDDAFMNTVKGGFIGAGVQGVATGFAGYGTATTELGRVAAIAGVTAAAADVVAAGGVDLLIEEEDEARIHEVANEIGTVLGAVDFAHEATEWTARRMATFDTVDEQLAALSTTISRQKQLRHLEGSDMHTHGGYFEEVADAQRVLDAVHDGSAEVIAMTRGNDLLVRYEGLTGIHANGRMPSQVPTNLFVVKGTASPSVFPTNPYRVN
jgi:hypothetical protein